LLTTTAIGTRRRSTSVALSFSFLGVSAIPPPKASIERSRPGRSLLDGFRRLREKCARPEQSRAARTIADAITGGYAASEHLRQKLSKPKLGVRCTNARGGWCPGPESNRHGLRRGILSLPVSFLATAVECWRHCESEA